MEIVLAQLLGEEVDGSTGYPGPLDASAEVLGVAAPGGGADDSPGRRSVTLWEGARRLPYFFSYGPMPSQKRAVLCPQCALEHANEPEKMLAHYTAERTVMCVRCGILIGPINEEEGAQGE